MNRIALKNSVSASFSRFLRSTVTMVLAYSCLLLGTSAAQTPYTSFANASSFSTLALFNGTDGSAPEGALVQGTDGNLYGTTYAGGAYGFGTVFKVSTAGTITTLYSFCAQTNCTDGQNPKAGLIQASDGNFYGTTYAGGVYVYGGFSGTVFKITPSGTLTTLHSFNIFDGDSPASSLVQASDGNLYGATLSGGPDSGGTVFKITLAGVLTTVASFCAPLSHCNGGYEPSGLVQATDGNLYGTTYGTAYSGGSTAAGLIFRITPGGTLSTVYTFCSLPNCADGGNPLGGLYQAANGNLYGTTSYGGTNLYGTVFKITSRGMLTTLHSFNGVDGSEPEAALIQATDGNFYGTTYQGGTNNRGTVFKVTPSGNLISEHSFDFTYGYYPTAALVQHTNGVLYGTTPQEALGGKFNGTIFSETVGLGAFVETQTSSGTVGASVVILGTNLTGASSVTFNGTPATFNVTSSSEITATVPTGAKTGFVVVTTPSGTLTSNRKFTVTH